MNKKFFDFLYIILIISLIAFLIYLVIWLKAEAKSCVANPVKYFEDKNPDASCTCFNSEGKTYVFDNTQQNIDNTGQKFILKGSG